MNKVFWSLVVIAITATPAFADATGAYIVTGGANSVEFVNWVPDPGADPAVVTSFISSDSSGNEANFAYGDDSAFDFGQVSFAATMLLSFATAPNVDFVGGYLEVHNGTIADGTGVSQVTLRTDFSGLIFHNTGSGPISQFWAQTLDAQLNIFNSPNLGVDPNADADAYYFTGFADRAFHVLEGESATVEILFNYDDLGLAGFGTVVDGSGFVGPLGVPDNIGWAFLPVFFGILLLGTRFRRCQS